MKRIRDKLGIMQSAKESLGPNPPMTPTELKQNRKKLGVTQAELAMMVEVTQNTVARWEMGLRRVPPLAARVIRTIVARLQKRKRK